MTTYPIIERLRALMGNAAPEHRRGYETTAADAIARITELEVGLRRAIHLVETISPRVMWPMDDEDTLYNEQWASLTLELVREALAGKET